MSNRGRALSAAVDIVGTSGLRPLTHRAVDARAGLPPGTTSNYFRTRTALLQGVVEHMVTVETPEVHRGGAPSSADELADRLIKLVEFAVGPNRTMTAARLAMFVEAGHDERLRALLAGGRAAFEETGRGWFATLGAPDPVLGVHLILACIEGIFLQVIGGYARVDVPRLIRATVASVMRGDA